MYVSQIGKLNKYEEMRLSLLKTNEKIKHDYSNIFDLNFILGKL